MNHDSVPQGDAKTMLAAALRAHRAGALDQAEMLYRQALTIDPGHPDGLHLLSIVLLRRGRTAEAIEYISKALERAPKVADFWNSRGAARRGEGDQEGAASDFARAISLKPDYAEAQLNLGQVLARIGKNAKAVEVLRKLHAQQPRNAAVHDALGTAFLGLGRIKEAIGSFKHATELNPRFAEAHCHLGAAELAGGDIGDAIRALRRAIQVDPNFAEAHFNLANAYRDADRKEDALAAYRRTVEIDPLFVNGWNNLGLMQRTSGEHDQAIATFKRGIEFLAEDDKRVATLWNNLGSTLLQDGTDVPTQAIDAFRRAVALDPLSAEYHRNLGLALNLRGDFTFAMQPLTRAIELSPELRKDEVLLQVMLSLVLNEPDGAAQSHALARRWNEARAAPLKAKIIAHANVPDPDRRLRIGYVSPDFRLHPVAFFIEPALSAHDRGVVEVTCYAELPYGADPVTKHLRELPGRWRETTGLSDDEVAAMIRNDGIDILVDLAGHTAHDRLRVFAQKPAPVQVSWIGFPATTGLDTINWRLTDSIADPPGMTEQYHSERLWRLPCSFLCFAPYKDAPDVADPPFRRNGSISFGCFNNGSKIRDPVLALWTRVLKEVPGSQIIVKNRALSDPLFRKEMRDRFRLAGGDPAALSLRGFEASHAEHLGAYADVDIALDTFPYNGTTTTCEALWMGVPVVTLAGTSHVSRVGTSLLTQVGLTGLIAENPDRYVTVLADLARNHDRIAQLRATLRPRMSASPLCRAGSFTRALEEAFRGMWREWCRSAPSGTRTTVNMNSA